MLIAPLVVAIATMIERRLGPSAGGWVAALPIGFTVAVVAVMLDSGGHAAAELALSAAAHVPEQLCFAVVFALVMTRRGLRDGFLAGAATYVATAFVLAPVPPGLLIAASLPAFHLAARAIEDGRPRPGSPPRRITTAMMCAGSAVVVALAVMTSRLVDPATAGAVAAFPTVTSTLVVAVAARDGARAGAHVCAGLTRSLPCYLTFCLVLVVAEPRVGLLAVAAALLGCTVAGGLTWRTVPLPAA